MKHDVIIIGSGAGGSAAAYHLTQTGKRVLLLEKGPSLPRDGSTLDIGQVIRRGTFTSREPWIDGHGRHTVPQERFNLGGKTKWYGAALLRMARHEFEHDPAFAARAWPIGYDDLAPYYDEAEQLLGVRPFAIEPDLQRIVTGVRRVDPRWQVAPLPLGLAPDILSHPGEAARFDGFASAQGLKSDAEQSLLDRVRHKPNLRIVTDAAVTALVASPRDARRISGVICADGTGHTADTVLLAAGALHSPRLLQHYFEATGLDRRLPCAGNVGRHYKFHVLTWLIVLSAKRIDDVLRKTVLLTSAAFPHSSVQNTGCIDGEMFATEAPRWLPRWACNALGNRAYGFFLQTEDGSHPDNRVLTMPDRRRQLDYDLARLPAAAHEHRELTRTLRSQFLRLGYLPVVKPVGIEGTAHACGTLMAGTDPASSVVDSRGRVHGLDNLYVVDGSVLPRSSRVNPALTIYAWALRVASLLPQPARQSADEVASV